MPIPTRSAGKSLTLTDAPGHCQGTTNPILVSGNLAALVLAAFEPQASDIAAMAAASLDNTKPKYSLGRGSGFPTERRPKLRPLTDTSLEVIEVWIASSGVTIGLGADTPERVEQVYRLLYTWRDCFATRVQDIQATDLIEHSIDLVPNAKPVAGSPPKYTAAEREFANRIFPELEDAGIIVRRSSPWGVRTKFPLKKKGSTLLRVVHNFIPVNHYTIKSAYPMHHLKEVIATLIKLKY